MYIVKICKCSLWFSNSGAHWKCPGGFQKSLRHPIMTMPIIVSTYLFDQTNRTSKVTKGTNMLWPVLPCCHFIGVYSEGQPCLQILYARFHAVIRCAREKSFPRTIMVMVVSWENGWSLKMQSNHWGYGQTSATNTHCGVMVSKKCEWCQSLRLISWVAWQ